jgi:hypothetical protein
VVYGQFDSKTTMELAFELPIKALGLKEGDCARDIKALAPYEIRDEAAGQVACYRTEEGVSQIDWTDDWQFVYGRARREDLADVNLFAWWVLEAGPLESGLEGVSSGTVLAKDAASLAQFPDGSFETTVMPDASAFDQDPQLTLLTGAYRLDLSGGIYSLTRSTGDLVDQGSYGLSKGGELTLSSTDPACSKVGIYMLHVADTSLMFEPSGKDRCGGRAFILTSGSWTKTEAGVTPSPGSR